MSERKVRQVGLVLSLLRPAFVVLGPLLFLACALPPAAEKPTPREILAGAIETDLQWGATQEEVTALLRREDVLFHGPVVDEARVKGFPDKPELWISTIDVSLLDRHPGLGCGPVTKIKFRFSPGRGLYDIRRDEGEMCVDPL